MKYLQQTAERHLNEVFTTNSKRHLNEVFTTNSRKPLSAQRHNREWLWLSAFMKNRGVGGETL